MSEGPIPFRKLDVAPAYRVVFETVERLIMEGKLKPGDVLPTETELAERFQINRSTLREGIRLLEQNGLVERGAAKRLTVSVPQILGLASQVSRALVLHDVTFLELWELYMAIEPVAAGLAAAKASEAALDEMAENLAAMEASVSDLDRFFALDIQFHGLIARAADNRALMLAREPINTLMMPAAQAILPKLKTYDRVIGAHRRILAALRQRNEDDAARWMRKHSADFKRGYELIGLHAHERIVDFTQGVPVTEASDAAWPASRRA